jgi:hypothetical protein
MLPLLFIFFAIAFTPFFFRANLINQLRKKAGNGGNPFNTPEPLHLAH